MINVLLVHLWGYLNGFLVTTKSKMQTQTRIASIQIFENFTKLLKECRKR